VVLWLTLGFAVPFLAAVAVFPLLLKGGRFGWSTLVASYALMALSPALVPSDRPVLRFLAAVLVVVGEALLTGAVVPFGYAALLAVGYDLFVRYYEEPALQRLFGEAYARYCHMVPRWLPRLSRCCT
jgi:hypothetical protein